MYKYQKMLDGLAAIDLVQDHIDDLLKNKVDFLHAMRELPLAIDLGQPGGLPTLLAPKERAERAFGEAALRLVETTTKLTDLRNAIQTEMAKIQTTINEVNNEEEISG